jgi:hypothetical protein
MPSDILYDAFISYDGRLDRPVVQLLQRQLQNLGKAWRRRAVRIFRDESSLPAAPELWPSIERALERSRYFIVFASPEVATSHWVNEEVQWWFAHRTPDTLLIVLTAGELQWDHVANDFIWNEATPLPPAFKGAFATEPNWIDFSAYRTLGEKEWAAKAFLALTADLSSTILAAPKDAVEFGVSHPSGVRESSSFLLNAWVYRRNDRTEVISRATRTGSEEQNFWSGGAALLPRGTRLSLTIEIEPWKVEPDVQSIVWNGEISSVSFRVHPTAQKVDKKIIGNCKIYMNDLRIGVVFFEVMISTIDAVREYAHGSIIRSAFASYASRDRSDVLARVQGIEKLGVIVFLDVHNLRSGDQYASKLFRQIDLSDVLYLFWSRHARKSKWVEREWRYGLEKKGLDFIDPVPLADPRKVPPPPELADTKHFDDWTRVYIDYENSLGTWGSVRRRLRRLTSLTL